MNAPTDQDHFNDARECQERYQDALREVGIRIPSPVLGQTYREYRRKTLHALQQTLLQNHELGKAEVRELKNDSLDRLEPQILEAAATERMNPRNVPPGQIVARKTIDTDAWGNRRPAIKFIGSYIPQWDSQESFVKSMTRPGRRVVNFMRSAIEPILSRREIR